MRSIKTSILVCLSLIAFMPSAVIAQASAPAPAKQQTPEQYLRALFYDRDSEVMKRDGAAIVSMKDVSLEARAWYVGGSGTLPEVLKVLDGMKKEAPDSAWTLAARSFFASDFEQAVSLCERAVAKDSRDDILLLCTGGIFNHLNDLLTGTEEDKEAFAEVVRKFLDRHRPQFEGSALGLVWEAGALSALAWGTQGKEQPSDEVTALIDRALKLEPGNESALAGKIDALVARKMYKEAAEVYEKFPAPIDSRTLHWKYWSSILSLPELGDEEIAKRLEADGRVLIDRREPTEGDVGDLLVALWRHSAARADAMTDLIEKRYPNSKLSEAAMMARVKSKLGGEEDLDKVSADTRSELADKLLEFLRQPGRTSEETDREAAYYLSKLTHYMEMNSERLFEAARLARPENRLLLVRILADRKAHLSELEEMTSEEIEARVRKNGADSVIWHYDGGLAEREAKFAWARLAQWEDVLGWIYLQQGKVKEAEPKLLTAEKLLDVQDLFGNLLDEDLDTLLHLGRLNTAKGNYLQAEEYLGRAMSVEYIYPDEHPAIAAYKELYLRQHGSEEGLDKYLAVAYEKDRARRKKLILKERIAQPKPIPVFKLKTIEGSTIASEELKGKVVVINFWGTWCGPCKFELPEVQKFYEKYKDNPNVVFLTIDAKDSVGQVKKFLAEKKFTFPVMMEGDYLEQARVHGFPTTWFIDRSGNKVFEKVGSSRRIVEEFTWRVEALLESSASGTGTPRTP